MLQFTPLRESATGHSVASLTQNQTLLAAAAAFHDMPALAYFRERENELLHATAQTVGDYPDDTLLLRFIQVCHWAGTLARLASHPAECRVVGNEGRSPLHVACDNDAPAVVIQALLRVYPEASIQVGTSNMTPLHITCSSNHASVHVVRVLLEGGLDEQLKKRDVDGDLPLHAAARCGAPREVLEVLLRAYPDAVHVRDYEGLTPLLRLWVRYFVILGNDVIESVNCAADLSGELLEAWNKTELLLRCAHHGTLQELPSQQQAVAGTNPPADAMSPSGRVFRALHAACAVDCPRAVLKIATRVYPHQLNERDEESRTPLLIAAAAPIFKVHDLSDEGYSHMLEDVIHGDDTTDNNNNNNNETTGAAAAASPSTGADLPSETSPHQASVIEILLQANQGEAASGACVYDRRGRLPLHVALSTGKRWAQGVGPLVEAYPESLAMPDPETRLYPFQLAASGSTTDVGTVYELLRKLPAVMDQNQLKLLNQQQQQRQQQIQDEEPSLEGMNRSSSCTQASMASLAQWTLNEKEPGLL